MPGLPGDCASDRRTDARQTYRHFRLTTAAEKIPAAGMNMFAHVCMLQTKRVFLFYIIGGILIGEGSIR